MRLASQVLSHEGLTSVQSFDSHRLGTPAAWQCDSKDVCDADTSSLSITSVHVQCSFRSGMHVRAACRQAVVAPSACGKQLLSAVQNNRLNRRCVLLSSTPRLQNARKLDGRACLVKANSDSGTQLVPAKRAVVSEKEGPSTDFKVIWGRLSKVRNFVPELDQTQRSSSFLLAADFAILD